MTLVLPAERIALMNRRNLLATCGAAAVAAKTGWTQRGNPLDRIAVLSWSFRDAFRKTRAKNGWVPDTDLDILDYPQMIADRYDIHNVEVQTMYLDPAPSFIADFKERLKQAKSKLVSIAAEPPDEVNQALGGPDEAARAEAIAVNIKWIDYAAAIGSPILMINQGNLHDDPGPLTDSARKLVEYGRTKNVTITAEPRGSSGSKPEVLAKNHARIGNARHARYGELLGRSSRARYARADSSGGRHLPFEIQPGAVRPGEAHEDHQGPELQRAVYH